MQLLELRKDRVQEDGQEIDALQAELTALNTENEALRHNAFRAGHSKVQAKRLGEEHRLLYEETTKLRQGVDSLTAVNNAIEVRSFMLHARCSRLCTCKFTVARANSHTHDMMHDCR